MKLFRRRPLELTNQELVVKLARANAANNQNAGKILALKAAVERLTQERDRERKARLERDAQIEKQAVIIEQAEVSLKGRSEQVRELKRERDALKERNTLLLVSDAGRLRQKIDEQARQLQVQENLIARYEGRPEQAVRW